MIIDEIEEKKNLSKEYYSNLIIGQYNTEKNKSFLKDIFGLFLEKSPFEYTYYFDLLNSEGDWLTRLAYDLYGINREFDNVILTDNELKEVCKFAIIKNNIKILSLDNVVEIIYNIYKNKLIVDARTEQIVYFTKAIIKFNLLPKPIGSTIRMIKLPQNGYKYLYLKEYKGQLFNTDIYVDFYKEIGTTTKVRYIEQDDIVI